jgi:hypothetical protein
LLPPGDYSVTVSRGPEYHVQTKSALIMADVAKQTIDFRLQRWIHPASRDWHSGDHHIHAAGCAHYENPIYLFKKNPFPPQPQSFDSFFGMRTLNTHGRQALQAASILAHEPSGGKEHQTRTYRPQPASPAWLSLYSQWAEKQEAARQAGYCAAKV